MAKAERDEGDPGAIAEGKGWVPVGCHRKKRKSSPCWLPSQQTEDEGLAQNVILPNGLADPLGMELLEL